MKAEWTKDNRANKDNPYLYKVDGNSDSVQILPL